MMLADVNVLIGAFRDDARYHEACLAWVRDRIDSDEPFGVSTMGLSAVVRITTHKRFFASPSTPEDALGFSSDLLAQPHCRPLQPGPRHWPIFAGLVIATNARAKLVTDAWFAALAIEHCCEWVTLDSDFERFPVLRWRLLA
jgi:toxin-antitoxin system PIN domain toxin